MAKSWFGWLAGKNISNVTGDRRSAIPKAAIMPTAHDFDPLTGALRWNRFLEIMDAEQKQAPGVLLMIDLSTSSVEVSSIVGSKEAEILPWLAEAIRQAIRSDDLLAHVEGCRFAALLRGAPQDVGTAISERILQSVDNTLFMTTDGITRVDVTIGGVVFSEGWKNDIVANAISNLDLAQNSGSATVLH